MCDIVFKYKDYWDFIVCKIVVFFILDLVSYVLNDFVYLWLYKFMVYLFGMFKKDKECNDVFFVIGNIVNLVKSVIVLYLDGVLIYVWEGFSV